MNIILIQEPINTHAFSDVRYSDRQLASYVHQRRRETCSNFTASIWAPFYHDLQLQLQGLYTWKSVLLLHFYFLMQKERPFRCYNLWAPLSFSQHNFTCSLIALSTQKATVRLTPHFSFRLTTISTVPSQQHLRLQCSLA